MREDERTINRVSKYLERQNNLKKEQLDAVLHYIQEKNVCRSKLILNYFGEKTDSYCGVCSYCIAKNSKKRNTTTTTEAIIILLNKGDLNSREIEIKLKYNAEDIIFALQQLLDNDTIMVKPNNKYSIKL